MCAVSSVPHRGKQGKSSFAAEIGRHGERGRGITQRVGRRGSCQERDDAALGFELHAAWVSSREQGELGIDRLSCVDGSVDDLENATAGLTTADGPGLSGAQCHAYWERMADLWRMRYDAGHNPGAQAAALSNAEVCP
jgi:hypothetical protein